MSEPKTHLETKLTALKDNCRVLEKIAENAKEKLAFMRESIKEYEDAIELLAVSGEEE